VSQRNNEAVLDIQALKMYFPVMRGLLRRKVADVKAVDGVSFKLKKDETLGLVGESGCGKTTTGRVILRALEPTAGSILFRRGAEGVVDVARLEKKQLKPIRRGMQMVFQDPYSSLNPRMPVLDIVAEPLKAHGWRRRACEERVRELMDLVGLDPRHVRRYPHAFSGGQRQRIGIARALALSPSLIVADEPVSALDVSVQAQILNLLEDLQEKLHLTYLFIAHDLSVIRYICHRVAVMYMGKLVEVAETRDLFARPRHPYTSKLIAAAPTPDPHAEWMSQTDLEDPGVASAQAGRGCAFAPRCRFATDVCRRRRPRLEEVSPDGAASHQVACHRCGEIQLEGVHID
jgi:peptide/nickel transport system ATP-binding protein